MVQDRRLGRALMLRDTQGVTSSSAVLPIEMVPLLARFTGASTCADIARALSGELGETVPVEVVVRLATELEDALFVDGPPYRKARAAIAQRFADADVREASHAGGAYHGDPTKLRTYIDADCLGTLPGKEIRNGGPAHGSRLVGLVAPHIDPWRGARCYGAAYSALAASLPADADTFVLLGTSHAPMKAPFALCRKDFATPLGNVIADRDSIDALSAFAEFDPYADQLNHKREHSLEFQAVFLQHLLQKAGRSGAKIIPILAGLGENQQSRESPSNAREVGKFLDGVRKIIDAKCAVVIAGADLAHVGPRFGDPRPFDAGERSALDATDRESLACAEQLAPEAFWEHVAGDLDERRICGLAPMYSLLATIDRSARGVLHHYEQTIDPDEGSIVSHAAMGFYV